MHCVAGFIDGATGRQHAVWMLKVRHAGQLLAQLAAFVIQFAAGGAIAPTDDRAPQPARLQPASQPGHDRRLAGSTQRQVANADDRYGQAMNRCPATVEAVVSQADGGRVGDLGRAADMRAASPPPGRDGDR